MHNDENNPIQINITPIDSVVSRDSLRSGPTSFRRRYDTPMQGKIILQNWTTRGWSNNPEGCLSVIGVCTDLLPVHNGAGWSDVQACPVWASSAIDAQISGLDKCLYIRCIPSP